MARHTYSPKLKAQVVLEVLIGEKTPAQVAKAYGVHPNSVQLWKRRFLERAPEIFSEKATVQEYERRIRTKLTGTRTERELCATATTPSRRSSPVRSRSTTAWIISARETTAMV